MRIFLTLLLISLMCISSGCYALRKKFTRKKKYKKKPQVYVDFKDYPLKPHPETYIDYYLFVRGWLDELKATLEQKGNFKRQKRAVQEAVMNFEQIIAYFNQEGKERTYPLYERLLHIQREIEANPNMSQIRSNRLLRRIEQFKREFEADLNYNDATKWMK